MTSPIVPGEGINNTLVLGQLLYHTISKLKELKQPLKIAYASHNYLHVPILATLPKLGVRLMFHSSQNQELALIEILSFSHLKFTYNGNFLNDIVFADADDLSVCKQVAAPKLKEIYNKIFGPTFPGKLDLEKRTYVLSYPGIAFKFRIELRELAAKLANLEDQNDILSKLTNWDRAGDIPCESLAIFKGEDYATFLRSQTLEMAEKTEIENTPADAADTAAIEKVAFTLSTGTAQILFQDPKKPPQTVQIGKTSQQDMLRILGPPDAYFNKFDSRLLIHKHLKVHVDANSGSVYKFHNYFRLGLDFLYNLNPPNQRGGVLEKIIVHNGGVTESLDFMQWNKCNWEVRSAPDGEKVDSSMYFDEFGAEFIAAIDNNKAGPVLLNRNESEITNDDDLEIVHVAESKQVLFQTASAESLGSKPSNEFKTWGQLKLYGYSRCVWEVIESNNCVSCVTIY